VPESLVFMAATVVLGVGLWSCFNDTVALAYTIVLCAAATFWAGYLVGRDV
jgi:hypothetical protein